MAFDKEMQKALAEDGKKLEQLTGEYQGPEFWFDEDFNEEDDEMADAEMNCSMMPDGQCGQAGSEYCDFECPFRR